MNRARRGWWLLAVGLILASGSGAAALRAWQARQPFWLEIPEPGWSAHALAFDPSGQWIVGASREGRLWVWSLETRALVASEPPPISSRNLDVSSVAFTGSGLLVDTRGDRVRLRTLPRLETVAQFDDPGRVPGIERAAAAGPRLALVAEVGTGTKSRGELHVWNVAGAPRLVSHVPNGWTGSFGFLRTGEELFATTPEGDVTVHSSESGVLLARFHGEETDRATALSPMGDRVALVRTSGDLGLRLEVRALDGTILRTLEPSEPTSKTREPLLDIFLFHERGAATPAFAPDGQSVAVVFSHWWYAAGTMSAGPVRAWLEVWDVDRGERSKLVDFGASYTCAPAFSPSGEWLAVGCGSRVLVLRP